MIIIMLQEFFFPDRELLTRSEEHASAIGGLKDQIASLHDDKSALETELQSVKNELSQKNTVISMSSKVRVAPPLIQLIKQQSNSWWFVIICVL